METPGQTSPRHRAPPAHRPSRHRSSRRADPLRPAAAMKVFFDTNVYVAEALLGRAAERMINATMANRWRIYSSDYVLDEVERVMARQLGFSRRLATLTKARMRRRSSLVSAQPSRHAVPRDAKDSPI